MKRLLIVLLVVLFLVGCTGKQDDRRDSKPQSEVPAVAGQERVDVSESGTTQEEPAHDSATELIIDGEDELRDYLAKGCNTIESIVINNVNRIPDCAFYQSSALKSIRMNNVQEIGADAFRDCTNLEEIAWPENLKMIGECAFMNTGITSVILPESLEECGVFAFNECARLKEVFIPGNLKKLRMGYMYCDELQDVTIANGVEEIDLEVFSECPHLKELEIPETVITFSAFVAYRSGLERIIFNGNPTICGFGGEGYEKLKQIIFLGLPPLQDEEILDDAYPDDYGFVVNGKRSIIYYPEKYRTEWEQYLTDMQVQALTFTDVNALLKMQGRP